MRKSKRNSPGTAKKRTRAHDPGSIHLQVEGCHSERALRCPEHFIDLCRLLGEPTPAEADSTGGWYCFEKSAKKAGGGDGWADVWKRGHFGWEYKGKGKDLQAAFKQLQLYTPALEYPPLLIVCDLEQIVIHTAFTGTVPEIHILLLDDLLNASKRRLLKWAFSEPDRLKPGITTHQITEQAARKLGDLAVSMRARGHIPYAVAHFLNRVLFCMFAEDTDLLPRRMFTRLLEAGQKNPPLLPGMLEGLFGSMADCGLLGIEVVDWFNGGLFDSKDVLPLENIEQRDAVLNADNTEAQWPEAEVIIGNPPFLGDKKMIGAMGEEYVTRLREHYKGRVPGGADLVTYWFEKARAQIEQGRARYAGLVATNSIRGGANRKVLERVRDTGAIFEVWSDEPWVNEGAAVRVSLVTFGPKDNGRSLRLDGKRVGAIHADLTAGRDTTTAVDLTSAKRLPQNRQRSFMGTTKVVGYSPMTHPTMNPRASLMQSSRWMT